MTDVNRSGSATNRSLNAESILSDLRGKAVEGAANDDVAAVIMICCLIVVGGIGNMLLLDVYSHNKKKVLSTYFIAGLASIDLTISLIILPTRIILFYVAVPVEVCEAYLSAGYTSVSVSIMLFIWIAFDRYQSVCLITSPLVTMKNVKYLMAYAFVSGLYASVIAPLYIKGEITLNDGNTSVTILMRDKYPCYITSLLSHPHRTWDPRYIVHFVFAISFLIIIVFVTVLYSLIFKTLRNIDRFRGRCKTTVVPFVIFPDTRNEGQALTARQSFPMTPRLEPNVSRPATQKDSTYDGTEGLPFAQRVALSPRAPSPLRNLRNASTSAAGVECAQDREVALFNGSHKVAAISINKPSTESSEKVGDTKAYTEDVQSASALRQQFLLSDIQSSNITFPTRILDSNATGRQRKIYPVSLIRHNSEIHLRKVEHCVIPTKFSKLSAGLLKKENETSMEYVLGRNTDSAVYLPQSRLHVGTTGPALGSSQKLIHVLIGENIDKDPKSSAPYCNGTSSLHNRHWTPNIKTPVSQDLSVINTNNCPCSESHACATQGRPTIGWERKSFSAEHNYELSGHGYQDVLRNKVQDHEAASHIQHVTEPNKTLRPASFLNEIDQSATGNSENSTNKDTESTEKPGSRTNTCAFTISGNSPDGTIPRAKQVSQLKAEVNDRLCQRQVHGIVNGNSTRRGEPQARCSVSIRVSLRLFLVTLTYILCWVPFYLMELGIIRYNSSLYNVFYIANVVNPLIHFTTSEIFRHDAAVRLRYLIKKIKR